MKQPVFTSDLNNEGTDKTSWPAKPDTLFSVPSLLRSDEDLKWFFQFFPEATICLLYKYPRGAGTIEKKWYDFTLEQLKTFNQSGYGVFFTPCDTLVAGHKTEDFATIRAWYCDIDIAKRGENLTEEEIQKRKEEITGYIFAADVPYTVLGNCEAEDCRCGDKTRSYSPTLPPSLVVESRNGFHLYWFAWHEKKLDEKYSPINGLYAPSKDRFDAIEKYICERWSADTKACKLVQLLRLPGFYNTKGDGKFMVEIRPELSSLQFYCEDEWETLCPGIFDVPEPEKIQSPVAIGHTLKNIFRGFGGLFIRSDICEKVKAMPQDQALLMLSGLPEVNGEIYTLKPSSGGKHMNIYINGESSACFIDLAQNAVFVPKNSGRGSPNVIEWVKWYRPEFIEDGKLLIAFLKKIYGNYNG